MTVAEKSMAGNLIKVAKQNKAKKLVLQCFQPSLCKLSGSEQ